jgi:hypothetical protein
MKIDKSFAIQRNEQLEQVGNKTPDFYETSDKVARS